MVNARSFVLLVAASAFGVQAGEILFDRWPNSASCQGNSYAEPHEGPSVQENVCTTFPHDQVFHSYMASATSNRSGVLDNHDCRALVYPQPGCQGSPSSAGPIWSSQLHCIPYTGASVNFTCVPSNVSNITGVTKLQVIDNAAPSVQVSAASFSIAAVLGLAFAFAL
ncbi:hypothetical protein Tdes44962_MAKER00072 [Teratosphaeria destructans]|uniref:Uncharacterized protein n=1 Tax=Teratosphaeria destructans TaxID=418781 RepID=A0A9W7T1N6_9PEZI|nr:hypothetical protein Tdes44962_MAKER00072 [Teratosphaeria destructans]